MLKNELGKWRNSGIVDEKSAQKISDLYHLEEDKNIFGLIGYIFFGLALLVLVGANWQDIPRALRLVLLFGLTSAVHLRAIKARQNSVKLSDNLFFLGNLCFLASIALISQMYHMGKYFGDGLMLFCVGVLPLVIATKSPILTAQLMFMGAIWLFMEVNLGSHLYSYALILGLGAWISYRKSSSWLLFLSLFGLLIYAYNFLDFDKNFTAIYGYVAFLIFGISYILPSNLSHNAHTLRVWAVIFGALVGLMATSFFSGEYLKYNPTNDIVISLLSLPLMGLALLKRKFIYALFLGLFCVLNFVLLSNLIIKILASFVVLACGIWLIKLGEKNKGIAVLFLLALVRYMDLVGDYLGASALFLIFGLIFIYLNKAKKSAQTREQK